MDSLTHSIPYLVPVAAAELERIGEQFADITGNLGYIDYDDFMEQHLTVRLTGEAYG